MLNLFSFTILPKKKFDVAVSRKAMEITEQLISEMGAEIHDDLIQKLSIFRLYLDQLERSASDPVETGSLALRMRNDFEEVIQAVRRISRRLYPVRMEQNSFQQTIEMLCQNMERPGTSHIHVSSVGTEHQLNERVEVYLLRMVQELIHNAFRHSSAWHIWVRLNWSSDKLVLEIEDDGTGHLNMNKFIRILNEKYNTLRLRSQVIGASIKYVEGNKGLLAVVEYPLTIL